MIEPATVPTSALFEATCEIAAAYVSNNHVAPADLPALLASIHASVAAWASGTSVSEVAIEAGSKPKPTPAQIRKSITPERLISFIDGMAYKTLKRHLRARGLDAASYRERYGLPMDYPMTAPDYSARRSELAKGREFGRSNTGRSKKSD